MCQELVEASGGRDGSGLGEGEWDASPNKTGGLMLRFDSIRVLRFGWWRQPDAAEYYPT